MLSLQSFVTFWKHLKKHLEMSWRDVTSEKIKMVPNSPRVNSQLDKDKGSMFQTLWVIFYLMWKRRNYDIHLIKSGKGAHFVKEFNNYSK